MGEATGTKKCRLAALAYCLQRNELKEVMLGCLHTIMFHRSMGKDEYRDAYLKCGGKPKKTLCLKDVNCKTVEYSYVKIVSVELSGKLSRIIEEFEKQFDGLPSGVTKTLFLDFHEVGKETTPWEVWQIKVKIFDSSNPSDLSAHKDRLHDNITMNILTISSFVNQGVTPRLNTYEDVQRMCFTNYPRFLPFLFKHRFESAPIPFGGTNLLSNKYIFMST